MEIDHPALLVLRILCRKYQHLETLFRVSQESFSPCLRDFHSLLHTEVLLTCFRGKVRRPCFFSFSFQQLLLTATPKHNWPTLVITAYVHIYIAPWWTQVLTMSNKVKWDLSGPVGQWMVSLARESIVAQKRREYLFPFLPPGKISETKPGVTPPAYMRSHHHHYYCY